MPSLPSHKQKPIIQQQKLTQKLQQKQQISISPTQQKMKISHYLDQSNLFNNNNLPSPNDNSKQLSYKQIQAGTNQSTDRCSNICEQSSIQIQIQPAYINAQQSKKRGSQLSKLEGLLRSQKMFVNPDRWGQFLDKAMHDQQFHKALNVFLYSYFIQHYN